MNFYNSTPALSVKTYQKLLAKLPLFYITIGVTNLINNKRDFDDKTSLKTTTP